MAAFHIWTANIASTEKLTTMNTTTPYAREHPAAGSWQRKFELACFIARRCLKNTAGFFVSKRLTLSPSRGCRAVHFTFQRPSTDSNPVSRAVLSYHLLLPRGCRLTRIVKEKKENCIPSDTFVPSYLYIKLLALYITSFT